MYQLPMIRRTVTLATVAMLVSAGHLYAQTFYSSVGVDVRDIVGQSMSLSTTFTSPQGIAAGKFVEDDALGRERVRFSVSRFPLVYRFPGYSNSWCRPFVGVHGGLYRSTFTTRLNEDMPDRIRLHARAVSGEGGASLVISPYVRVAPSMYVMYGRLDNRMDFISPESAVMRDYIDGVAVNWNIGTLTVGPALKVFTDIPVGIGGMGFDAEYTSLYSQTLDVEHYLQDVRSKSYICRGRIRASVPLGMEVRQMPLSFGSDFSVNTVGGDIDRLRFCEIGGQVNADASRRWSSPTRFYAGMGYAFNPTLNGISVRLGMDF